MGYVGIMERSFDFDLAVKNLNGKCSVAVDKQRKSHRKLSADNIEAESLLGCSLDIGPGNTSSTNSHFVRSPNIFLSKCHAYAFCQKTLNTLNQSYDRRFITQINSELLNFLDVFYFNNCNNEIWNLEETNYRDMPDYVSVDSDESVFSNSEISDDEASCDETSYGGTSADETSYGGSSEEETSYGGSSDDETSSYSGTSGDESSGDESSDDETSDDETSDDETSDDETSDDETSDDETSDDETSDDETSDDTNNGMSNGNVEDCDMNNGMFDDSEAGSDKNNGISNGSDLNSDMNNSMSNGSYTDSDMNNGMSNGSDADSDMTNGTSNGSNADSDKSGVSDSGEPGGGDVDMGTSSEGEANGNSSKDSSSSSSSDSSSEDESSESSEETKDSAKKTATAVASSSTGNTSASDKDRKNEGVVGAAVGGSQMEGESSGTSVKPKSKRAGGKVMEGSGELTDMPSPTSFASKSSSDKTEPEQGSSKYSFDSKMTEGSDNVFLDSDKVKKQPSSETYDSHEKQGRFAKQRPKLEIKIESADSTDTCSSLSLDSPGCDTKDKRELEKFADFPHRGEFPEICSSPTSKKPEKPVKRKGGLGIVTEEKSDSSSESELSKINIESIRIHERKSQSKETLRVEEKDEIDRSRTPSTGNMITCVPAIGTKKPSIDEDDDTSNAVDSIRMESEDELKFTYDTDEPMKSNEGVASTSRYKSSTATSGCTSGNTSDDAGDDTSCSTSMELRIRTSFGDDPPTYQCYKIAEGSENVIERAVEDTAGDDISEEEIINICINSPVDLNTFKWHRIHPDYLKQILSPATDDCASGVVYGATADVGDVEQTIKIPTSGDVFKVYKINKKHLKEIRSGEDDNSSSLGKSEKTESETSVRDHLSSLSKRRRKDRIGREFVEKIISPKALAQFTATDRRGTSGAGGSGAVHDSMLLAASSIEEMEQSGNSETAIVTSGTRARPREPEGSAGAQAEARQQAKRPKKKGSDETLI